MVLLTVRVGTAWSCVRASHWDVALTCLQVGCVLARWAKTAPFLDESGGLSFMTEAAITRDLNRWLDETTDEISIDFDLPVKRDLVKNALRRGELILRVGGPRRGAGCSGLSRAPEGRPRMPKPRPDPVLGHSLVEALRGLPEAQPGSFQAARTPV